MDELIHDLTDTGKFVYYDDDQRYLKIASNKKEIIEMGYSYKEVEILNINGFFLERIRYIIVKNPFIRKKYKNLAREEKRKIILKKIETVIQFAKFKSIFDKFENGFVLYLKSDSRRKSINDVIKFSRYLGLNLKQTNNIIIFEYIF